MDLTVCHKPKTTHKKTRSDSVAYKSGCFKQIDCSDITLQIKNTLSCLNSKLDQAPLTPRRSIMQLSEVKRIAEKSVDKSKLKRVKSRLVATINLNTKQSHSNCYNTETQRDQSSKDRKQNKVIRRSITISDTLSGYEKITPIEVTPKSSFNILKQITLQESNNTSQSQNTIKHKIIRPSINLQDGPKRCIKIIATARKNQDKQKNTQGMYYTFCPYQNYQSQNTNIGKH